MPMEGHELHKELDELAHHFREKAVPRHGRYINQRAHANENGVLDLPPPMADPLMNMGKIGMAAMAGLALATLGRRMLTKR